MAQEPDDKMRSQPAEEGPSAPSDPVEPVLVEIFADQPDIADNAPTIISSKSSSTAIRPEETFAGTLRGRRLSHFELLQPIGVGGMAAVIRARDTQLDRFVALKILPPEMAKDSETVRRFHQEAKSAAKLDHENIARVYFCGEDQGLHFIAFEFVEGDNLRAILEKRGRLPVEEAIQHLLQIAAGLDHAAARGVVHRDIKPSNIIVSPNGRAKLVDMGLARHIEPQSEQALTQSGVTLGTFDYISPEQAMEPREADFRSDIYSLGCTFYHMLTGQTPVPEGTAAKKLHHHQHVAPIDPRQLNPDIPDEVAAVLGRMMAKDPKDRYQRPEHLVQHLLQLAQKHGGAREVSKGLLFVDAPLPSAPAVRPWLVGVAAVLLLAGLVMVQGMLPIPSSSSSPGQGSSPRAELKLAKVNGQTSPNPPEKILPENKGDNPPPVAVVFKKDVDSPKELAEILLQKHAKTEITVTSDMELDHPGLLFDGKMDDGQRRELIIKSRDPNDPKNRPKLKLAYALNDKWKGEKVGNLLTVKGGKVILQGLRIEVDARQASDLVMAGLRIQEGGHCDVTSCEFVQENPSDAGQGRLSSVVVEGPGLPNEFNKCYFLGRRQTDSGDEESIGGQEAVTLTTDAIATFTNCAFAPHDVLFHIRESKEPSINQLKLSRCSALLTRGAVFNMDEGVFYKLMVEHCLFSNPGGEAALANKAVLIQQRANLSLNFTGKGNRYHNLSAFWEGERNTRARNWEDFLEELKGQGKEELSEPLLRSPWLDPDPVAELLQGQPATAFQIDPNRAELRQVDKKNLPVGVQVCSWRPMIENLPQLIDGVAGKVVDPNVDQPRQGYYRHLSHAITDAQPGDVIFIKERNDKLPIEIQPSSIPIIESALHLTIRAFPTHNPVLTLGSRTADRDAALFRIFHSEVTWENLRFLLRPHQADFKSQAVVALSGSGVCIFKSCLFTLDAGEFEGINLAAVVLGDPKDAMKMKMDPQPQRTMPQVRFENCFVRGKGDLIFNRASRPLILETNNSVVALTGSLLHLQGGPKDMQAMSPDSQMNLSQTTTYLTGHLLDFHTAQNLTDLIETKVTSDRCLFISAQGKALVHFEGEVVNAALMKRLVSWTGSQNAYVNFTQMLDQQPTGIDKMPLAPVGNDNWPDVNNSKWFAKDKLVTTPVEGRSLAAAAPEDFQLKPESDPKAVRYGALLKDLPHPASEVKPSR